MTKRVNTKEGYYISYLAIEGPLVKASFTDINRPDRWNSWNQNHFEDMFARPDAYGGSLEQLDMKDEKTLKRIVKKIWKK